MHFIHTADWHLGRSLYGYPLLEEQAHLLEQLTEFIKTHPVDALFISGDLFDRAVPPAEALSLLDRFISEVILELSTAIVIIPGNHDSALRLAFGSKLLQRESFYISSSFSDLYHPIEFQDTYGSVFVHPLPYCHNIPETLFQEISFSPNVRRILLAHLYVKEGELSESERLIGGAHPLSTDLFTPFDYVALGHLHRPQRWNQIAYSGSLMKYSLSEEAHTKSFYYGTLTDTLTLESIPFKPKRELLSMRGSLESLLSSPSINDYVSVILEDTGAVYDSYNKLKHHYPYLLQIQREHTEKVGNEFPSRKGVQEQRLYTDFYHYVLQRKLSSSEKEHLDTLIKEYESQEREFLCASTN